MVEWKKLGEVCEILDSRRKPVSKGDRSQGAYPYYGANGIQDYVDDYIFDGTFLLLGEDGSVINKDKSPVLHWATGKIWVNNHAHVLSQNESSLLRYLYYILQCTDVSDIVRGVPPKINQANIRNLVVPIPSLSEQQRIVEQLDTFTSSIENLKEQIAQRRKQYEYYRDQLLDLEGKEEKDIHSWGESCEMIKGNGVQKVDFVDEGIGCIHYGQIYTHYGPYTYETNKFVSKEVFEKARKASKSDIIMTDTSENVEDICKSVAYLGEDDIAVSNHALIIKHQQNPKFLSFSTQTNSFLVQKRKYVVGAKVSGIKPDHLAQIKIFLPSLSEQQRIVSILDTFEASVANLEQQLAQREKQYEYYRNKLLTFE